MTDLALFDMPESFADDKWDLRRVNHHTAELWFGKHHYLGTVGNAQAGLFGLYAGDLIAVVAVGNAGNVHGVAKRYALEAWRGNAEITRVAVHPDAPTNTASRAVAAVCRRLAREGWEWLFSYADTGQGHHGGIYQALNATYVGLSDPGRSGFLLDGTPIHPRSVVATFGTQAWPKVRDIAEKRGQVIEKVDDAIAPKHTYILVIAEDPRRRFRIRRHLKDHAQPYPKRAVAA
jgi:hypothetical protein